MSGFPAPPHSPGEPALDDERASHAQPLMFLGRPEPSPSFRGRFDSVLARVPISPGRLVVLVVGAILALVVGLWLLRPPPPAVETTLPRATPAAAHGAAATSLPLTTVQRSVVVDAAGSVARPGLYRLPPGARVNDLIRAAGGLRPGADPDRLNLAAPLADGQRLYVPKVGELTAPPPLDPTGGSDGATDPAGTTQSTQPGGGGPAATVPLDLNTATADQLDTLPGVGPSTAAAILDYRTQHGSFRSVDELLDVRGIGDAKLAALRAKVRV